MTACLSETPSTPQKDSQRKLHHENHNYEPPPDAQFGSIHRSDASTLRDTTPPIIHKVRLLHRDIYIIGHKLPKRDKLGIHGEIETACLKLLALLVEAAFMRREAKLKTLEIARVNGEVMKNLMRTEYELGVIDERTYLRVSKETVEISKMLNGWISYAAGVKAMP